MAVDIKDVEQVAQELQQKFDDFKAKNDKRVDAIEQEKGKLAGQVETLNGKLSELENLKSDLEKELLELKRPAGGAQNKLATEHKEAFVGFLRKGREDGLRDLERKALQVGTDEDGGYAVPEALDRNILTLLKDEVVMRQEATVITVGGSDYKKLVNLGGTASGWVGETDARSQTATSKLGLIEPFMGEIYGNPQDTNAESRLHRKEAREVARESLVLLKNRLDTLPLKKSGTIAVVGALADSKRDMMGSWSAAGVADQSVTVLTGIKEALGDNGKVIYAKGANVTDDKGIVDFLNLYENAVQVDPRSPQEMIDEAVAAAKQSDVVVAVVGEAQGMAHEASSRTDITLPQSQRNLIAALKATGKPLVLVLMNGRPLALVKEDQQADALLETWFAGTEGGHAIADVLFGDYNPSGKLPMSFPRSVGQIPTYYSHLNTGRPYNPEKPNKYTSRYFDEANGPLYPFGYGLSYTTFSVSDVNMSSATMPRDGSVTASVQVTNTGNREGATVIQLYLQDVTASMSRPVKMLRGFKKVTLKPGETQTVSFPIDVDALKFWNQQMKYVAEPGKFNVFIGVDSARVKQSEFELL